MTQITCIVGSVAPDLVMVPSFFLDRLAGKQALAQQGRVLRLMKNLSHSFVLWGLVVAIDLHLWQSLPAYLATAVLALGVGGVSHMTIDLFTHGNNRLNQMDALYLWPLQRQPFNIGSWDYRYDHGVLKPKPLERMVLIVAVGMWSLALL